MKALTIRQPWAHLVIHGPKHIENRTWRTRHRGPLAIHASLNRRLLNDARTRQRLDELGYEMPDVDEMAFGALIGVVDLVDVVEPGALPDDPLAIGPVCWVFAQRRALEMPITCTGSRMLWEVPRRMVTALRNSSSTSEPDPQYPYELISPLRG